MRQLRLFGNGLTGLLVLLGFAVLISGPAIAAPPKKPAPIRGKPVQTNPIQRYTPPPAAQPASQPSQSTTLPKEEVVDLSTLGSSEPEKPQEQQGRYRRGGSRGGYGSSSALKEGVAQKRLKIYFDFLLYSQPGIAGLTFANFHSYVFLEVAPENKLEFMTDISSSRGSPSFYELDWHVTEKITVRAGKIWIPFDENMAPHNLYGGRTNVSQLMQDASKRFLPNLWTDHGVGSKLKLMDESIVHWTLDTWVVNGFQAGGTDPAAQNPSYPSFTDTQITALDNNRNKALGARTHIWLSGVVGAGASFQNQRWNNQNEIPKLDMNIYGADAQLRLGPFEISTAAALMQVELKSGKMTRGGAYAETGFTFGTNRRFKALGRWGFLQLDDRVIDFTDQQHAGATLLYSPRPIEISLTHTRDLKEVVGKLNVSYTALRLIMQF